ncbi:uncharacterized protein RCH25_025836 [Pelodytes ibericus]
MNQQLDMMPVRCEKCKFGVDEIDVLAGAEHRNQLLKPKYAKCLKHAKLEGNPAPDETPPPNLHPSAQVIGSHAASNVAGPLHAQCKLEWNFGIPCFDVYAALVTQIKLWTTADNCEQGGEKCLYDLKSANEHYIVAKHTSMVQQHVDVLTFKLVPFEEALSCHVSAFSVSEPWYLVLDNGTNYCNLHNLVEGSGLDVAPGYTESSDDNKCTQYSSANCTIY